MKIIYFLSAVMLFFISCKNTETKEDISHLKNTDRDVVEYVSPVNDVNIYYPSEY